MLPERRSVVLRQAREQREQASHGFARSLLTTTTDKTVSLGRDRDRRQFQLTAKRAAPFRGAAPHLGPRRSAQILPGSDRSARLPATNVGLLVLRIGQDPL